ncbi:hypothetical protein NEMIN01_1963 [Nematocida minor]|uniref:uncharacterized protein n=1 Tax=Nematocida minor TaxID=1912983 RepID=UPI00221FACEE|nr:uncharacterized protein NEMIN01_1963 [Nematocida minor]KAI5192349.1 hypothetical protein NEMIN01_1963 [Nematocida minor]
MKITKTKKAITYKIVFIILSLKYFENKKENKKPLRESNITRDISTLFPNVDILPSIQRIFPNIVILTHVHHLSKPLQVYPLVRECASKQPMTALQWPIELVHS